MIINLQQKQTHTVTDAQNVFIDVNKPDHGVEIRVDVRGKVLWVNVDGRCMVRINDIPNLQINDDRPEVTK